ncbi:DHA2 family efflux MFS transporter permease subunit [Chungangia koreensis]|uniref:DHA2 family efflux MFS transporter permease subunit n=1 Tax=Chungangia koreensis TaxID=752657 RepID=A0ABV8X5S6_9LACT
MDIKELQKKPPYGMIAILFIGAFIAFLNNTLLNVALPTIMAEFDVKPSLVQWLTTGYMLVNGILMPASAFFIQRFTNRGLFITAMSLFSLGTLLAIIAPEFYILVIARMIQAMGSAMMMPLLMNIMLTSFPVERRGSAMGMFGLVMITAPAIGPTLSGWVVEHYTWRTLFEIILPLSLLILIYSIFRLKNITPVKKVHLDVFSLVLSTIGFGGLLYGFSFAGDAGWSNPLVYGSISIGAIGVILFVLRQLRMDEPLLEFRIYKYPMFALSSVISVIFSVAMFSAMILTPLYVQIVRGTSPFHAGLMMLPGAIIMAIMSPITGRLFDKYGAKTLAIVGLTITVVTTYMMSSTFDMDASYTYIVSLFTIRAFGMSMIQMPVMTNGMNQLPLSANPHGTAVNNTLNQVSGAIGSALLLTAMDKHTARKGEELAAEAMQNADPNLSADALLQLKEQITLQATLDGIQYSFLIATIISAIALVLAFFIKRVTPPKTDELLRP